MPESHVHARSKQCFFRGKGMKKVKKKWGEEHWIVNREYCGKKLILKKNHRCSMHSHKEKDEVFYLQSGAVKIEINGKEYAMEPGDFVHIPADTPHRFTGLKDSEIFEFSTTHRERDSFRTEYSGHVEEERFERQNKIVKAWKKAKVLVVGDVMLDTYLEGEVERVSPEAPVPVVRYDSKRFVPGGAANAARNVSTLGGKATLIGVCGADDAGRQLELLLKESGVKTALITDSSRCTTEKQRLTSGGDHQMVRIDYEHSHGVSGDVGKKLLQKYRAALKQCDVVLLSDYAKGVLKPQILSKCIELARKAKKPVLLDPKPYDSSYLNEAKGVTLLLPNGSEAVTLTDGISDDAETVGKALAKSAHAHVLLTMGSAGMMLVPRKGKITMYSALAEGVVDVSGAGDTVAAVVALSLAVEADLVDGADLANHAAALVVEKVGTATTDPQELLSSL